MSSWDQQTEGENLVWFGEIERKLAKLSMTTFTYHLPLNYFMVAHLTVLIHISGGVGVEAALVKGPKHLHTKSQLLTKYVKLICFLFLSTNNRYAILPEKTAEKSVFILVRLCGQTEC